MSLDWRRLRAVVLQSDDWGLCAWVPDEVAHRKLADQPAFRSPAGARYGRSTLEHAADVGALAELLQRHRGADGESAVLQANTIVANPDHAAMRGVADTPATIPLVFHPDMPTRWSRPGLWDAVRAAEAAGVWWAELHGLHHLPEQAWLAALRRGDADALLALDQSTPICQAVEGSSEYDPSESRERRAHHLRRALLAFRELFGRTPSSFCPPDYRFDDWLESEAESLGLTTLQGKPEQVGAWFPPLRRRWLARRFPHFAGARFHLPPRIAFEPCGDASAPGRSGLEAALRAVQAAWAAGRPAILSTHRMNYAHLDEGWSAAGRTALEALLRRLCEAGAVFLTDEEVRQLVERGTSVRAFGGAALVRRHTEATGPCSVAAPDGVHAARLRKADRMQEVPVREGHVEVDVDRGTTRIEWERT